MDTNKLERKYKIFVSSTQNDLEEIREKVIQIILSSGNIPVAMELFNPSGENTWEKIEYELKGSDYYVLIVGFRYGSIDEIDNKSFTQKEYETAKNLNIPVIPYVQKILVI